MNMAELLSPDQTASSGARRGISSGSPGSAPFAPAEVRTQACLAAHYARPNWRRTIPLALTLASCGVLVSPQLVAASQPADARKATGASKASGPLAPAQLSQFVAIPASVPTVGVLKPRLSPAPRPGARAGVAATPEAPARVLTVSGSLTRTASAPAAKIIPVSSSEISASNTLGAAPIAPVVPLSGLGEKAKIIKVPSLELPPLSKPLPQWMQAAAVRVDRLEKPVLVLPVLPKSAGTRVAQNPLLPPVVQPPNPVTNSDRLPNQIEVATSTFVVLLTTTDLQTVAVADPSIADVAVVNARSVLLNGKSPGTTSLVIVDGQKIRQYVVRVTPASGTRPVDVAQAIGLPGVSVRALKDALILEGEVSTEEEAKRAAEIAAIYAPKVINQLSIRALQEVPARLEAEQVAKAEQIKALIGQPNVTVRLAGDTVILSGTVESPQQIQDADIVARTVSKNVVNLIKLPTLNIDQLRQSLGATSAAQTKAAAQPGTAGALSGPDPFTVDRMGDQIILAGTVDSQAQVDAALAASGRTGLTVVSRLQVAAPMSDNQKFVSMVASAIGRPGITVRGTSSRLVLEGSVTDTNASVAVEQIALSFVDPATGRVDNMLTTQSPILVNVDVMIAEINKDDARKLGVEYGSVALLSESESGGELITNPVTGLTTQNEIFTDRTTGTTFNAGTTTAGARFGGVGVTQILDPLRYRLNALYSKGNGRLLSNPRTTVLSGRTATFQVGGQVPVPALATIGAAGSTTAIEFKDFGVLLDIIPNAMLNGNVTMRVRTEVSQPDFSIGVTPPGGGSPIPGFRRRSSVTEVTVPKNGTVALSGLISNDVTQTESSVPFLSKLPIIGSLFKSRSFQRNETELVIFVQPRVLPNPLNNNESAFAGVFAVGKNSTQSAVLGNPGITSFDSGAATVGAPR